MSPSSSDTASPTRTLPRSTAATRILGQGSSTSTLPPKTRNGLTQTVPPTISGGPSMNPRAVKGMNDILPDEIGRWHRLESAFRTTVELHGYEEVRPPIVEPTSLFVRQIGEVTDIVEKEMYSFKHHDDELTLRPEGTAGVARAYVEHNVQAKQPVSHWYYLGPMFRAER